MLIDRASPELLRFVVEKSMREIGRRLPVHEVHRWWSRRFSAIYRFILASYLYDGEELVREALENPELMRERSRGKVFFEPFAGGGTGLVEAVLAGWDVYGIDLNPVAVQVARAGLMLASEGIPEGFEERAVKILDRAFSVVKKYWVYGSLVTVYVLISRNRAPTWISTVRRGGRELLVVMCPKCYEISLVEPIGAGGRVKCEQCGIEYNLTIKPVTLIPNKFPEVSRGWRAFAIEFRDLKTENRIYVGVHSQETAEWIADIIEKVRENAQVACESLSEEIETIIVEGVRLRRAGIRSLCELFTPRQLATFKAYIDTVKTEAREGERLLYAIALSESTKTCSLLAKWYPLTGEPVPAGGIKSLWIPEYTVETNPLAHKPGSLKNFGRRVISSALKAQLSARNYIAKHGGPYKGNSCLILGDSSSHNTPYPSHIDLAVIDPPYGLVKSYVPLSLTHCAGLKLFEALTGDNMMSDVKLKDIALKELVPGDRKSFSRIRMVLERLALSMGESSRAVLMYNSNRSNNWLLIFKTIIDSGLTPTAIYWVLGETPGSLARSRIKGMYLIVLKKGRDPLQTINIIFEEIFKDITYGERNILAFDVEVEKQTYLFLLKALEKIRG